MVNGDLIIDIDAVMDFVLNKKDSENQTDIVEMYGINEDGKFELQNKQISESKSVQNDSNTTIKYDFIKNLFSIALGVEDINTAGFNEEIVINSLYKKGFIKEA